MIVESFIQPRPYCWSLSKIRKRVYQRYILMIHCVQLLLAPPNHVSHFLIVNLIATVLIIRHSLLLAAKLAIV